jgi:hypothetical protein
MITKEDLRLKISRYCLIQGGLGWRNTDGLVLRCVDEDESQTLLIELHVGFCGGHYATRTIMHKILRAGYYWPTLYADIHRFVRSRQPCQRFVGRQHLVTFPLQPVICGGTFSTVGLGLYMGIQREFK